jgi:hypothetical protein
MLPKPCIETRSGMEGLRHKNRPRDRSMLLHNHPLLRHEETGSQERYPTEQDF